MQASIITCTRTCTCTIVHVPQLCTDGSVVESSPATRGARVRFPVSACLLFALLSFLQFVLEKILPFLGDTSTIAHREGAIEVISCKDLPIKAILYLFILLSMYVHVCTGLLERTGIQVLCYIVLLVMPVLGRMSDQEEDVRLMASQCFANLVTLMPLEVFTI